MGVVKVPHESEPEKEIIIQLDGNISSDNLSVTSDGIDIVPDVEPIETSLPIFATYNMRSLPPKIISLRTDLI